MNITQYKDGNKSVKTLFFSDLIETMKDPEAKRFHADAGRTYFPRVEREGRVAAFANGSGGMNCVAMS